MEANWEIITLPVIFVGSLFVVFLLGYRAGWSERGRQHIEVKRDIWDTERRDAHQRLQLNDDLEREMAAIEPAPEKLKRRRQ